MVCGYHASQATLAPQGYLTGAEWNWEELYPKFVKMAMAGQGIPNFYRGGLKEGLVKMSPYTAKVGESVRKQADEIKGKLISGGYAIFKGPLKDNKGKTVIAAGVSRGQNDVELEKMDWLVESVVGSTG
jgi:simple sugar transport system substrate-binding protein